MRHKLLAENIRSATIYIQAIWVCFNNERDSYHAPSPSYFILIFTLILSFMLQLGCSNLKHFLFYFINTINLRDNDLSQKAPHLLIQVLV